MKRDYRYKGILPPLITPVKENGEICELSVKQLIHYVLPYSSALVPALTSGEGWKLSKRQWSDMIAYTLKYSGGLDVLAGVEFPTTREVIEYGVLAKQKGVQALIATTPFNNIMDQRDIYEHFYQICLKTKMPVIVYNEEGISGNHIEFETMLKICRIEQIVGIKEASGNVEYTNKVIQAVKIPVFQGWEHLAESTENPAGYIFPISNLEPKLCFDMYNNPSTELQQKINNLCKQYAIADSAPYANIKKYLKEKNIIKTDKVI